MTEDQAAKRLLGTAEAAERLSISPATLRRWIDAGEIKAIRLPRSGHRRISQEEVERKRREIGLDG